MPQVSKNPLGKETNQEIQAALWWLLARLNSDDNIKDFLGGFLTNTEKIMLAKRLAIAFLANKNYDYKDISNALKVSTNTVYRIKDAMDRTGGNYKFFIKKLEKREEFQKFSKNFNRLIKNLTAIIPPQKNDMKGRAKWLK